MHCKPAWLDPDRIPTLFLGSGPSKIKKDPVGSTKNVSGYSWEPNPAPQSATLELFIQTDELLVGMLDFIRSLSSANLSISGENSAFENIGIEICYLNIGIGIGIFY